MDLLKDISLKAKNFKCFGEEPQGFEKIMPFNIIIGRNNSGKSALLDLLGRAVRVNDTIHESLWNSKKLPEIQIYTTLEEDDLQQSFSGKMFSLIDRTMVELRAEYSNRKFLRVAHNNKYEWKGIEITNKQETSSNVNQFFVKLNKIKTPFSNKRFVRLQAERDIYPEKNSTTINVVSNGNGATNIVQEFANNVDLVSHQSEEILLDGLNDIYADDAYFKSIVSQRLNDGRWEMFLGENTKGKIALSESGSGLKTVLLVLIFLHLIRINENIELSKYIFGFEELENNLHPALLRRLLDYLVEQQEDWGCTFFLTTHSNVMIDYFSREKDAQLIHVTHDGTEANCESIDSYAGKNGLLEDLGNRASDLLQTNCLIWVEGPSDRIYMNKWIELYSAGELKEGIHYQCIISGGSVLKHFDIEDPESINDTISILSINKNSIILLDSDKKLDSSALKPETKRFENEVEKANGIDGYVWITKGREIENYLPLLTINRLCEIKHKKQIKPYTKFEEYIDKVKEANENPALTKKKVPLARAITEVMERDDLKGVLDLEEQLKRVCGKIKEWNNLVQKGKSKICPTCGNGSE
jgi:AAA15 family ATPase/GTPase